MTTQLRYVVRLYQEKYKGLSVNVFRRILEAEHEIAVPDGQLRAALREAGLFPQRGARAVDRK